MSQTNDTIPATRNEGWGFFGTMNERAEAAWPLAMTAVANATGETLDTVRLFLDSRFGRHFADDVLNAVDDGRALADAIAAAMLGEALHDHPALIAECPCRSHLLHRITRVEDQAIGTAIEAHCASAAAGRDRLTRGAEVHAHIGEPAALSLHPGEQFARLCALRQRTIFADGDAGQDGGTSADGRAGFQHRWGKSHTDSKLFR